MKTLNLKNRIIYVGDSDEKTEFIVNTLAPALVPVVDTDWILNKLVPDWFDRKPWRHSRDEGFSKSLNVGVRRLLGFISNMMLDSHPRLIIFTSFWGGPFLEGLGSYAVDGKMPVGIERKPIHALESTNQHQDGDVSIESSVADRMIEAFVKHSESNFASVIWLGPGESLSAFLSSSNEIEMNDEHALQAMSDALKHIGLCANIPERVRYSYEAAMLKVTDSIASKKEVDNA